MNVVFCCPRCGGVLEDRLVSVTCAQCRSTYPQIDGIPDLRMRGTKVWIDVDEDTACARRLVEEMPNASAAELVHRVYSERPGWDERRIALRTRQVVTAPQRLTNEVQDWLRNCVGDGGTFLDLGSGPGMLHAATPKSSCITVDVSMTWLIVAKRLIQEHGGRPMLAAALAEALPFANDALDAVVSLDVIEHVTTPGPYLEEINRVLRPGGRVALSTPNRFSLTAEPHVHVWGVGWLPRAAQREYVRIVSGKDYDDTRLLSSRDIQRLLRRHTTIDARIVIPQVSAAELAVFPPWRARIARLYNRLTSAGALRPVFLGIGPFFRIIGEKRP